MRFLSDIARSAGLLLAVLYCGMMALSAWFSAGVSDFNGDPNTLTDHVFSSAIIVSAVALVVWRFPLL